MPATRSVPAPGPWCDAVREASDEDLVRMLGLRPDLALAELTDLGELADRMVSPASVGVFAELADRPTSQVLEALCVLPSPTTVPALAAALGSAPRDMAWLVEYLRAAGMVLVDGERLVANPGLASAIPHPFDLGPPAASLLGAKTTAELRAIARRLDVAPGDAKPDLVRQLAVALGDADRIAGLARDASPGVRELLEFAGRQAPLLTITHGVAYQAATDGPVGWCLQRGLLIGTDYATAAMPREVGLAYRGGRLVDGFQPVPPPLVVRRLDQEATDRAGSHVALEAVAGVAALGEAWGAAPAKLLAAGGLGVREVRRAAKQIGRSEAETARLTELAACVGLLDEDDGVLLPTGGYDEWSQLTAPERWLVLATAWLTLPLHLSIVWATDVDGKPIPPLTDSEPEPAAVGQRALLLALLAEQGPGSTVDPSALAERAEWQRPTLWDGAVSAAEVVAWVLDEARLLGIVADGGLTSFGRLVAGGDAPGAGEALAALVPPVVADVIIQADLTATVPGEPAAAVRAELDLLADVESRGHATVWRFSSDSLRRGMEAGRDAAGILAWLGEHAARGVPQPLAYLVEDLDRRFGRARVGAAGCYLRSDDTALVAEILADKRVARLGLHAIAPTVAVSDRDRVAVAEQLRAAGYLPAVEEADGTLSVRRPPTHRVSAAAAPRAGRADPAAAWGDLDDLSDLFAPGELDDDDAEALLAELIGDPATLAALTALPTGLADLLIEAAAAGRAPEVPADLEAVVARLRAAPVPARASPPVAAPGSGAARRSPFPRDRLFEQRPTAIAKDPRAIERLLRVACEEGWPVRMSYVNAQGVESDSFAEVLDVGRADLRVRYLGGRPGGGRIAVSRVRWARVATAAEEEAHDL